MLSASCSSVCHTSEFDIKLSKFGLPAPYKMKIEIPHRSKNKKQLKRRVWMHKKRFGLIVYKLMQDKKFKDFTLLTYTSSEHYKSIEYNRGVNRNRRLFNYYDVNRINCSEYTENGYKHCHTLISNIDIEKLFQSASFKRFCNSYKLTADDYKGLQVRSMQEVLLSRWLASKWGLGFVDVLSEAKALYLLEYFKKSYSRVSYSGGYKKFYQGFTSLVVIGYNNSIQKIKLKFQVPIFFVKQVVNSARDSYLAMTRLLASYRFYQGRYDYLRHLKFLTALQLKQLDYYTEKLGIILGL